MVVNQIPDIQHALLLASKPWIPSIAPRSAPVASTKCISFLKFLLPSSSRGMIVVIESLISTGTN
jgi:hypothetical protein